MNNIGLFIFLLLTSVCISCASWFPPDIYWNIKTKRFNNKALSLQGTDTLWILPPLADVRCRYSVSDATQNTELRIDTAGQRRAIGYLKSGIRKFLANNITVSDALLDGITEKTHQSEVAIMFKKFETDSLTTYKLSDTLVTAIKKIGLTKCLIIKVYWEYYSKELLRRSTSISYGPYPHSVEPDMPCVIITFGAILNVQRNEIAYYRTSILTPDNEQPLGYWGKSLNDDTKKTGQNITTNYGKHS